MQLNNTTKSQIIIRPDQKIFYDFFGHLEEDRFELTKRLIKAIS